MRTGTEESFEMAHSNIEFGEGDAGALLGSLLFALLTCLLCFGHGRSPLVIRELDASHTTKMMKEHDEQNDRGRPSDGHYDEDRIYLVVEEGHRLFRRKRLFFLRFGCGPRC